GYRKQCRVPNCGRHAYTGWMGTVDEQREIDEKWEKLKLENYRKRTHRLISFGTNTV
ncbi:MAG: hypothetical protein ACI9ON_004153, partial [Limisphaerales bacterium]